MISLGSVFVCKRACKKIFSFRKAIKSTYLQPTRLFCSHKQHTESHKPSDKSHGVHDAHKDLHLETESQEHSNDHSDDADAEWYQERAHKFNQVMLKRTILFFGAIVGAGVGGLTYYFKYGRLKKREKNQTKLLDKLKNEDLQQIQIGINTHTLARFLCMLESQIETMIKTGFLDYFAGKVKNDSEDLYIYECLCNIAQYGTPSDKAAVLDAVTIDDFMKVVDHNKQDKIALKTLDTLCLLSEDETLTERLAAKPDFCLWLLGVLSDQKNDPAKQKQALHTLANLSATVNGRAEIKKELHEFVQKLDHVATTDHSKRIRELAAITLANMAAAFPEPKSNLSLEEFNKLQKYKNKIPFFSHFILGGFKEAIFAGVAASIYCSGKMGINFYAVNANTVGLITVLRTHVPATALTVAGLTFLLSVGPSLQHSLIHQIKERQKGIWTLSYLAYPVAGIAVSTMVPYVLWPVVLIYATEDVLGFTDRQYGWTKY